MKATICSLLICGCLAGLLAPPVRAAESRSIAGEWRIRRDPGLVGERERWFEHDLPGTSTITLPGSVDDAGLDSRSAVRDGLDGLYRLYVDDGPVWLQYSLMIPGSWKGKHVSLILERTHGSTRVWIDGNELPGRQDSLVAPHVHPLGAMGTPATRRLTIRLENSPACAGEPVDGVLYEGSQTNWNGLIGGMEIRAVDHVAIEDLRVFPDLERKLARVRVRLSNTTESSLTARLKLEVRPRPNSPSIATEEVEVPIGEKAEVDHELKLGPEVKSWDVAAPRLYLLKASVAATFDGKSCMDEYAVRFGLRSFSREGKEYFLNGRPIALRGTLDSAIFPGTGYPPASLSDWRRIFRAFKAHELSLARFLDWCPPEAAFAAADAEGLLLHVSAPPENQEVELRRILRAFGNHPSFGLMTVGFRPDETADRLAKRLEQLEQEDPRHLYTTSQGLARPSRGM